MKSQFLFRTYESAEIRAVCRHLRSDLDVIELGASIGVLSCHIRRKLAMDRHLYAIEPDPELVKLIERNLQTNGLRSRVTVVSRAIAKSPGKQSFVRSTTNLSGHMIQPSANGTIAVEGLTLRDLIAQFGIGEYALVCDIEGFEAELFAHEFESLNKCEQIIIELHHREDSGPERLIEQLQHRQRFNLQAQYGNVYVLARSEPAKKQHARSARQTA